MENFGNITTTNNEIIKEIGNVISSSFGVVGISKREELTDSFNNLVNHSEYSKGIIIEEVNNKLNIQIYIVVGFNFKVDLVLELLIQNIKWILKNKFDVELDQIDVYVNNIGRKQNV